MANIRYDDLQVTEGTYIPEIGKTYPQDDPHARLSRISHDRQIAIDENYPYDDRSLKYRFLNFISYIFILYISLGIYLYTAMGLRVHGRKRLRQYKKQMPNGAITIANHCYFIDCPAVLIGVHAGYTTRIPMFAPNFSTKFNFFMRVVGGVPIPENNMAALKKFNAAFDAFNERKAWFHIFPEAARWDFYKPLRPFQKGAFSMAYKYNKPILPCAINYRERTGIYRLFGPKDKPLLTVEIGEPIYPDTTKPRRDEVERMLHESHEQMLKLMGITHNTWEEKFND